jgi:hypothetical protein
VQTLSYRVPVPIDFGALGDAFLNELLIAALGRAKYLPRGSRLRREVTLHKKAIKKEEWQDRHLFVFYE